MEFNLKWKLLTYVISKSSKSMSLGRTSPKALWNTIVCSMPALSLIVLSGGDYKWKIHSFDCGHNTSQKIE